MSTFGEELRRERELRRISLREISEATKISLRHLEALERNNFRYLPGGVFNRGFVRAYSQFIGVDPEAMVNAYLLQERAQETQRDRRGAARPRRSPPDVERARRHPFGRLLAWGLLLLLVLGGLIAGIYYYHALRPGADPPPGSGSDPPAARSVLADRPVGAEIGSEAEAPHGEPDVATRSGEGDDLE